MHAFILSLASQRGLIADVVTTAVIALHALNADHDMAFTTTLCRCAADPLYAIRDTVEQLAERFSKGM